jgi:tetratricopeptide (TPR) repeat protein
MATDRAKALADQGRPARRRAGTAAVLGAAALAIGLAVYLAVRRPADATPPDGDEPSNAARADRAVARARRLLGAANQQWLAAAGAGPQGGREAWRKAQANYARAEQLLSTGAQGLHGRPDAQGLLAEVLLRTGRTKQAETLLAAALAAQPDCAEALWAKGLLRRRRDDPRCVDCFRAAAESPSATPRIWSEYGLWLVGAAAGQEATAEAERYLRKAYQAGWRGPDACLWLGKIAFDDGRLAEAAQFCQAAAEAPGLSREALALLAEVRMNQNEGAAAAVALRRALDGATGRQRADLLLRLGRARILQGRQVQAAEAFLAAAEDPALRAAATFQAAKCYYFAGRHDLASRHARRALALRPDDPQRAEWAAKIERARSAPPSRPAGGSVLDALRDWRQERSEEPEQ